MLTTYSKSQKQCVLKYNEQKRKQEEEEKQLAEQYGISYKEKDNEEENSIK